MPLKSSELKDIVKPTVNNSHNYAATSYAVGIGLTNESDLACAHCYRSALKLDRLSLSEVKKICSSVTVGSVNIGVGENGLQPQYHEILDWLAAQIFVLLSPQMVIVLRF